MVSAPALSFAANCCCLKTTQEKVTATTDMPPCHQMMSDQTDAAPTPTTSGICLCDAGLTTFNALSSNALSESTIVLKTIYDIERHNSYVSTIISPEKPPPILNI